MAPWRYRVHQYFILLLLIGHLRTNGVMAAERAPTARFWVGEQADDSLPDVGIVWTKNESGILQNDQQSFYSVFSAMGLEPNRIKKSQLASSRHSVLVVPAAAALQLNKNEIEAILSKTKKGAALITDGPSGLTTALGLTFGPAIAISTVQCVSFSTAAVYWKDRPQVQPFVISPTGHDFYRDDVSQKQLATSFPYGAGRVLAFSSYFDPLTEEGYSRFPNFPLFLSETWRIRSPFFRPVYEMYMDLGYRWSSNLDQLVALWRDSGVKAIFISGWYHDGGHVDLRKLLSLLHANGIKAFYWAEWPEISSDMWEANPRCREKTIRGEWRTTPNEWRSLMNLNDPSCREDALNRLKADLERYDWDGVNIAEIYFDGVQGPDKPEEFTPMNDFVRSHFESLSGFDPADLFKVNSPHFWQKSPNDLKSFISYRKKLSNEILESVLSSLHAWNANRVRPWELMATLITIEDQPQLADNIGVDFEGSVRIAKNYGVTLQLEDPYMYWPMPPSRYRKFGETYKKILGNDQFLFDINVVPCHPAGQISFPTEQPTGTELMQLNAAALSHVSRVAMYAESQFSDFDWLLLKRIAGSDASIRAKNNALMIDAPVETTLSTQPRLRFDVDGKAWPNQSEGKVRIPAGHHVLTLQKVGRQQ